MPYFKSDFILLFQRKNNKSTMNENQDTFKTPVESEQEKNQSEGSHIENPSIASRYPAPALLPPPPPTLFQTLPSLFGGSLALDETTHKPGNDYYQTVPEYEYIPTLQASQPNEQSIQRPPPPPATSTLPSLKNTNLNSVNTPPDSYTSIEPINLNNKNVANNTAPSSIYYSFTNNANAPDLQTPEPIVKSQQHSRNPSGVSINSDRYVNKIKVVDPLEALLSLPGNMKTLQTRSQTDEYAPYRSNELASSPKQQPNDHRKLLFIKNTNKNLINVNNSNVTDAKKNENSNSNKVNSHHYEL